jgi:HSP20 family molecular chaperone IbpA
MNNKILNNKLSRISIPGRLIQLLLVDSEFFKEVMSLKKTASSGSFPKYDQWCDSEGFHMEFALAGFSKKDLEVCCVGQEIIVRSNKSLQKDVSQTSDSNEIPEKQEPPLSMVTRSIARRNFSTNFFIGQEYDVSSTKASIKDGILHLLIPSKQELDVKLIEIRNGE